MNRKFWQLMGGPFILILIVVIAATSINFINFNNNDDTFVMSLEGIPINGNFIESSTDYKLISASADIPVIGSKSIPVIVFSKIDNEHITYSGLIKFIRVEEIIPVRGTIPQDPLKKINPNGITTYEYEKGSIFKGEIFGQKFKI